MRCINMSDVKEISKEYLKKPYSRVVIPDDESDTYTAHILEFPGCITQGATAQDAYERLEDVAQSWIEVALAMGQDIPLPLSNYEYGGKVALRLPKSLHKQATIVAERNGTSLNQFIVMAIAEQVGASNLCSYLIEEFERRLSQTVANLNPFIFLRYPTTNTAPSVFDDKQVIPYYSPTTEKSRLTGVR